MNYIKHSFVTKTFLTLALLSSAAILWQTLPAMQKGQGAIQELFVLNNEGKPSTGLSKLLEKFGLNQDNAQTIVEGTQKEWLRTADKERWEAEDPYANRKDELLPLFKEVGVVDEVKPTEREYDYVVILGALHARAQLRMEHAIKLWDEGYRFKEIVLLGSERALDPQQEPASLFGQGPTPKNEYEMMQWVYAHADLPEEMKKVKTLIINTPNTIDGNGKIKRANTADTIREWLSFNPKPGTCLIVSNQPHVGYQSAVAKTYLPESFKTIPVGNAMNQNARVCEILDALARWTYQENEILKKSKK
jgi:hypothetical protein